jgi:hypothetical protein
VRNDGAGGTLALPMIAELTEEVQPLIAPHVPPARG